MQNRFLDAGVAACSPSPAAAGPPKLQWIPSQSGAGQSGAGQSGAGHSGAGHSGAGQSGLPAAQQSSSAVPPARVDPLEQLQVEVLTSPAPAAVAGLPSQASFQWQPPVVITSQSGAGPSSMVLHQQSSSAAPAVLTAVDQPSPPTAEAATGAHKRQKTE